MFKNNYFEEHLGADVPERDLIYIHCWRFVHHCQSNEKVFNNGRSKYRDFLLKARIFIKVNFAKSIFHKLLFFDYLSLEMLMVFFSDVINIVRKYLNNFPFTSLCLLAHNLSVLSVTNIEKFSLLLCLTGNICSKYITSDGNMTEARRTDITRMFLSFDSTTCSTRTTTVSPKTPSKLAQLYNIAIPLLILVEALKSAGVTENV